MSVARPRLLETHLIAGEHTTFPAILERPPPDWRVPFGRVAEECRLSHSMTKAFAELWQFYTTLGLAR
jgi:hypothetical protein